MGPLNVNSRAWLTYAGEIEVLVKGNHLAMRTLAGPFRKGVRLYPMDPTDPLAFEAVHEGQAFRLVFERDGDRVGHLLVGFDRLRKRPMTGSLRFKAMAGLSLAATAVVATTTRTIATALNGKDTGPKRTRPRPSGRTARGLPRRPPRTRRRT